MGESNIQLAQARRSQRIQIAMPVVVRGANFKEMASTVAVNVHGCLVMLEAKVTQGDQIRLINPKTVEEMQCTVVYLGKPEDGKIPVGVKFSEPSPLFWRINFPPDDWLTSEERKRPGSNSRPE